MVVILTSDPGGHRVGGRGPLATAIYTFMDHIRHGPGPPHYHLQHLTMYVPVSPSYLLPATRSGMCARAPAHGAPSNFWCDGVFTQGVLRTELWAPVLRATMSRQSAEEAPLCA